MVMVTNLIIIKRPSDQHTHFFTTVTTENYEVPYGFYYSLQFSIGPRELSVSLGVPFKTVGDPVFP
jgi:hypothetical protein